MTNPILILALSLACLAMQGCILFTSSVNDPPRIAIDPPKMRAARGEPLKLTATTSDPDGAPPRVEWSTSPGDCSKTSTRPPTTYISPNGTATFTLTFDAGAPETVCVWALAVDALGATAVANMSIRSENQPPKAVIKVLAPTKKTSGGHYELYSYFRLSAVDSTDPDGDEIVAPQWEIGDFPADAVPQPKLAPCPGAMPSDFVQCLEVGGFAGDYVIQLTVGDGIDTTTTSLTLTVDGDHPACVAAAVPGTSPIVLDPATEGKTFSVTKILDDGAPWPTPAEGAHASPTFAWKVRRNAGTWQPIVGYDHIASLTLPAGSYATGDDVDVAVTISDGVVTHLPLPCDSQCPAGCPQSNQWTVEYR